MNTNRLLFGLIGVNLVIWMVCIALLVLVSGQAALGVALVAFTVGIGYLTKHIENLHIYLFIVAMAIASVFLIGYTGSKLIPPILALVSGFGANGMGYIVAFIAGLLVVIPLASYKMTNTEKLDLPPPSRWGDFQQFQEMEFDDGRFHERVAASIKKQTGYNTVPDGDFIRVFKGSKLVGLVRCCRFAKMASPDMVQQLVATGQRENVKTLYFATGGHVSTATEKVAKLHNIRLLPL